MLMIECSHWDNGYTQSSTCHCENNNYCTYGTRTMATLNHQRTICTVCSHSDMLIECSHSSGTICTVINVLTVTCWWLSVATVLIINMLLWEHTVHMVPWQWLHSIINMLLWELTCRCPGTICTVCSHSNMLMIECSHCPGTICTVIIVLTVTCWWLSVATVLVPYVQHMVPEQWLHSINMSLWEHTVHMVPGQWLHSIINMSL
jgi:hypothetical protein